MADQQRQHSVHQYPPFIPSPHFISESPARPTYSQRSVPVPLPPANLFDDSQVAAFNVDPGVPFLATAGPTEANDSDRDSIQETPPKETFVGGFVTGLRKAMTLKRGQRRDTSPTRDHDLEQALPFSQPSPVRDSGYAASSSQLNIPVPVPAPVAPIPRIVPEPVRSTRRTIDSSDSPTSPHHPPPIDTTFVPQMPPTELLSPGSIPSPVSAHLPYAPGYAQLIERPTPPHSDTSFNSYLNRIKKLAREVSKLPWVADERVTHDYYPHRNRRDQIPHHPAIVWHNNDHSRIDYQIAFDSAAMSEASILSSPLPPAPRRAGGIDLAEQFDRPREVVDELPQRVSRKELRDTHSIAPGPQTVIFTTSTGQRWVTTAQNASVWPPPNAMMTYNLPQEVTPPISVVPYGHPLATITASPVEQAPERRRKMRLPSVSRRSKSTSFGHIDDPLHRHASIMITPSSTPDIWEQPPHDHRGDGYVPYRYSENYYHDRYGAGIHTSRPPVIAGIMPAPR